jgi:hypothetical protein
MRRASARIVAAVLACLLILSGLPAQPRAQPKQEPVAETKLLMEGLALPNFRGLDRNLRQQPAEAEAWSFLRGQALLVAETGNLLMLRPPKSGGQDAWNANAAQLRESATRLARAAAERDYERSRTGLAELANTCNHCHQTFRVNVRIPPKE